MFEAIEKYQLETGRFPRWFYSLDNTLCKTRVIREIGGYPRVCPVSTGGVLRQAVLKAGYTWLTYLQCMSYLRRGYWHQLTHQIRGYIYRRFFDWYGPGTESFPKYLKGIFLSALSGALIARHQRTPSVFLAYPIYRYVLFHHRLHPYTKPILPRDPSPDATILGPVDSRGIRGQNVGMAHPLPAQKPIDFEEATTDSGMEWLSLRRSRLTHMQVICGEACSSRRVCLS